MFVLPDTAKLEALAEFAAGAGHEINNPLAIIIGRAQQLLKDEQDPQRRQMLMSIGAQAYRIRDMIGDTMLFGRPPQPELQQVKLADVAKQVITGQKDDLTNEHVAVLFEIPENLTLHADPTQLAIVLNELLRNSRQALHPDGGDIQIRSASSSDKPGSVMFEITDHGQGFTDVELEHAFDPFYSGRQAGRGLGFGLSKCWRIIAQHLGTIEIQSSPKGPTTVRIQWPGSVVSAN